ncbi:MAG TPA: head-tail adaptor protein [Rhizobiaceae bacterium]|nr:head-tail adaptor protein [Rhizobiaceae bacterium]
MKRLTERFLCQKKSIATDEFDNPAPDDGVWETQFSVRAELKPRLGGESVMAGRLNGRQPYVVTIRQSLQARKIMPDWQLVDANDRSRVLAVKSIIDPDNRNRWLEILAEEGVAA